MVPLRGPASSVHHKIGKEREEAVRFVTLRFAVLYRLLSENCVKGIIATLDLDLSFENSHSSSSTLRYAAVAVSSCVAFWPIQ